MPASSTKSPIILAFDTSGPHCAAALVVRDGTISTRFEDMAKGQAERLIPLLEELLADANLAWTDLDALAVGTGPGNFTGIRISVSAVRGLALALGAPAISVTNFEIMRGFDLFHQRDPQLVSLPAPRGANYVQLFENAKPSGEALIVDTTTTNLVAPFGTTVLGANSSDICSIVSRAGEAIERDIDPAKIPGTLIQIAVAKWTAGLADGTRPTPLYVKPPDAAPPRDLPPRILK